MHASPKAVPASMSPPLEDYLETIYLLVQEHGFARVRDIARARDVKAATVSVALRKLADAGLADYERREYTRLTPKGERAARRILARHRLLTRFFEEVLRMSPGAANQQACAMEHVLTDEAADRMVRFFEFLGKLPLGGRDLPALPARRARRRRLGPRGLHARVLGMRHPGRGGLDERRRPAAGRERDRDADLRHRSDPPTPARHGPPARDRDRPGALGPGRRPALDPLPGRAAGPAPQ